MRVGFECAGESQPEVLRRRTGPDGLVWQVACHADGDQLAVALQAQMVPFALSEWVCASNLRDARIVATDLLPRGVTACLVEGDGECVVMLDRAATGCALVRGLDELIGPWSQESWIYVGNLRSVS